MRTRILNGRVYLDGRFHEHTPLLIEGERIVAIGERALLGEVERTEDATGLLVIPGLVDVHTHGREGGDFVSADAETLERMKRAYAARGVTSVFATLSSARASEWLDAIARIRRAGFAGLHFEGCFLNPKRRGAHASELLRPLTGEELVPFLRAAEGLPCHVSAALELDTDGSFAEAARLHGATLGLGHTNATTEEALAALERGAVSFTHTYNAMTPLHHRAGGTVCAALLSDAYTELIADGLHIAPEVIRLTWKIKGPRQLVLVSDSIPPAGCPDGQYFSSGLPVTVRDGIARTEDGTIAGSTSDLFEGLRNLVAFTGVPLEEALPCATETPARMVGLEDRIGRIREGGTADLVLITPDLVRHAVYARGARIEPVEKAEG